jgi:hypothetical protein
MKSVRANRARGLTLFEVVISIALIALLLGALLTFFWQTLEIRDVAARAADRTQLIEQVLARMADELRGTLAAEKVGFPVQRFVGERRKITFLTTPLPPRSSYAFYRESEVRPVPEHDLREITYELWIDPEKTTEEGDPLVGGILRTERRAINPSLAQDEITEDKDLLYRRHDLWAPELGYLEFRYFDGVEWSTSWNVAEGNPLPQLIQITVGFDSLTREALEDQDLQTYPLDQFPLGPDVPNINRYSMMVRLPAADAMFTSRIQNMNTQLEELYTFVQPQGGTGGSKNEGTGGGP